MRRPNTLISQTLDAATLCARQNKVARTEDIGVRGGVVAVQYDAAAGLDFGFHVVTCDEVAHLDHTQLCYHHCQDQHLDKATRR
jgi:hypothetical protein